MKDAVYQKNIDNPLLYNGRKQDLRMFVVLQTYQWQKYNKQETGFIQTTVL